MYRPAQFVQTRFPFEFKRSLILMLEKIMGRDTKTGGNSNNTKKQFKVSIEGNVGCGKSTLVNYFKSFPEVDANLEPLNNWRNVQGHNLLMLTYAEPHKWNFTFQHYVQLTRLNLQIQSSSKKILIFERSLQSNRFCFVELAHDSGLLDDPDYIAMCEWYDWIDKNMDVGLDLIVYLRSNPQVVYNRMQQRGRPEESSVSLDYLTSLHEYYEKWLVHCEPNTLPAPVLVVDVNNDLDTVKAMYKTVEQYILGHKSLPQTGYVKEFGWGADKMETISC